MTTGGGARPGRAPMVLGLVAVGDAGDLTSTLFDALAHAGAGADGVVLTFDAAVAPMDRSSVADQVADTISAEVFIRSEVPMASSRHRLIVLPGSRRGAHLVECSTLAEAGDDPVRSVLALPAVLDEGALIGSVVAAVERGVAAVVTDRPRTARRTIDVVAAVDDAAADLPSVRSAACP